MPRRVDRAEAARRVGDSGATGDADDGTADALQQFLEQREIADVTIGRAPTTIWARPSRIGATRSAIESAEYWLSASVLTMTSAPAFRLASSPAMNARARPWLCGSERRIDTGRPRCRDRSVLTAVIDDQPFDDIESLYPTRQRRQRSGDHLLAVETGNLDDKFPACGAGSRRSELVARGLGVWLIGRRAAPGELGDSAGSRCPGRQSFFGLLQECGVVPRNRRNARTLDTLRICATAGTESHFSGLVVCSIASIPCTPPGGTVSLLLPWPPDGNINPL